MDIRSVLWLAPNFNHYKARFLNHLAKDDAIELTILSGTGREGFGDEDLEGNWNFKHLKVEVTKKEFGSSALVRKKLKDLFPKFDWILIPAEKKNLFLFCYAIWLKSKNEKTKIFSYNHPVLKSNNYIASLFDNSLTKFFYKYLDRVVFYTEESCQFVIKKKLIHKRKAFWANNTIDTHEVAKYAIFELPPEKIKTILFIGRLIPSKKIDVLLEYYKSLKKSMSDTNLELEIIGDGPDKKHIEEIIKSDSSIRWHGSMVDEKVIAPIMKRSSIVFVPGLSGLSINHAFAYGRPYFTLEAVKHGPEINYLKDAENGYILNGSFMQNCKVLEEVLTNKNLLDKLCFNAKASNENLSVEKWVKQMKWSLMHE